MNEPHRLHPRLIIFSRYPVAGEVKTRLLPALAPRQTAELHRALTEHTVHIARSAREMCGIDIELRTCGAPPDQFGRWLGDDIRYCEQGDGDLGDKFLRGVDQAFRAGAERALVIGADCPDLTSIHIEQALAALARVDVVIGPAADGGYYLIGFNRLIPELFADIPWGGDEVLDKTRSRAAALSLKIELLETLNDIDRPDDLSLLPPEIRRTILKT